MTALAILERPGATPAEDESAKQRQIIDGARAVFLAKGFDAASMNDIARAAGVSKGTLYVYFKANSPIGPRSTGRIARNNRSFSACVIRGWIFSTATSLSSPSPRISRHF